ncbi:response regulator [Bdellovibrio bacteriovorus]|uniref:response regulator n=1 Tax=Bdellovibrio TaxID=958 RepID=UPI0035A84F27
MARILLCDDSNLILKILEKRMQDIGQEVVGKAKDGEECVRMYSELKPDLLLLDITMPNKDGRECLIEILEWDAKANVIMISALMNEAVQADCLNHGAKAFIHKGDINSPEDFETKVVAILKPYLKIA